MKKCKYFDTCSAPLCPLDNNSLQNGTWFADEEICRKRGIQFIRLQKRIAEISKKTDSYFTKEMLDCIKRVRHGLKGLDPQTPKEEQIDSWISKHKTQSEGTFKTDSKKLIQVENNAVKRVSKSMKSEKHIQTPFQSVNAFKRGLQQ